VNPVKTPIRQRNYKKPTGITPEVKIAAGGPTTAPAKKPAVPETKVTSSFTKRPQVIGKNPKQARGDSATKEVKLPVQKELDTVQMEEAKKEEDLDISDEETEFKERETAPPKREAVFNETADQEEENRRPTGHRANQIHSQPDVKTLKPKAMVKELPPLPPSYSPPLPPSYSPPLPPSFTPPLPPSYSSPFPPSYSPPFPPSYSPPLPPSYSPPLTPSYSPPLSPPYSEPLSPSYNQYPPYTHNQPSPPSHNPPLSSSYHPPPPTSYSKPILPSYSQPPKPSTTPTPGHKFSQSSPSQNSQSAPLDPIQGVFVEPSSLSAAPYLYINKVTTPNVPKIPKSAPYPFVKPAVPPESSTSPYRSKLEDFTLPAGHLSQKRHTPPAPDNDINRMDSTGLAVRGKLVALNDDANMSTLPSSESEEDEREVKGPHVSIPRPPGTPRPRDAEDSQGEADTFSR